MKTKLIFNSENYDELIELEQAYRGKDLSCIIWELEEWLRENYNRDREDMDLRRGEISIDSAEVVRAKLREIMLEYGITFDNKIFG